MNNDDDSATLDECLAVIRAVMEWNYATLMETHIHVAIGVCLCPQIAGQLTYRSGASMPFQFRDRDSILAALPQIQVMAKTLIESSSTKSASIKFIEVPAGDFFSVLDELLSDFSPDNPENFPFDGTSFCLPESMFNQDQSSKED